MWRRPVKEELLHIRQAHSSVGPCDRCGSGGFDRQVEFRVAQVCTEAQCGKKEEGKTLPRGDGSQRIGARAGGHAAGGEDRHREKEEAGEAQADTSPAGG